MADLVMDNEYRIATIYIRNRIAISDRRLMTKGASSDVVIYFWQNANSSGYINDEEAGANSPAFTPHMPSVAMFLAIVR
jgi:hypothetical protein